METFWLVLQKINRIIYVLFDKIEGWPAKTPYFHTEYGDIEITFITWILLNSNDTVHHHSSIWDIFFQKYQ